MELNQDGAVKAMHVNRTTKYLNLSYLFQRIKRKGEDIADSKLMIRLMVLLFLGISGFVQSQEIRECQKNFIRNQEIYSEKVIEFAELACQSFSSGNYEDARKYVRKACEMDSIENLGSVGPELIDLLNNIIKRTDFQETGIRPDNSETKSNIADNSRIKQENEFDDNAEPVKSIGKTLSEGDLEEFKTKGIQKIKLLESYLIQIGSNSIDGLVASEAQENALRLFVNPDSNIVEVSSKSSGQIKKTKVRKYLGKLRLLNYDQVEIEWVDLTFTSDFIKGANGFYYGYAIFQQRFIGNSLDGNSYSDVTTKRIQVVIKMFDEFVNGELKEAWDVFLGDISVVQK